MDNSIFLPDEDLKSNLEQVGTICRTCLCTNKRTVSVINFTSHFRDLAGVNISESDGLPPWLCYECAALLQKAVRFKMKLLQAHTVLCDYLMRCAPFPIDAQDAELAKYASPNLTATATLTFDVEKSKLGYHKVLQHKKQLSNSELNSVAIPPINNTKEECLNLKDEAGFSDYEDNIPLEEFRLNPVKTTEEETKITPDELDHVIKVIEQQKPEEELVQIEVKKKKKTKKKDREDRVKKKDLEIEKETNAEPKTSIRKPIEIDPTKIKIITLNPEEQIKQREEESKANLKFPFQCNLCFKGFNFEAKLQNHMTKHSPSRGPFECTLCSMYLPSQHSYSVHMLIHTRRYECLECGRRMIDRASIVDHYRSQHEGVTSVYTCHVCGKISNNSKTHRGHMRNHHSGTRPACATCGKTFVNKDSLAEHMQIHEGIKNYSCGECGKRFRTRTQIKHHQARHSDVKSFYCVECDVRFKTAHSLRQHLLKSLKHKDKQSLKFACSRCDKHFETEALLTRHELIQHEGRREHRCMVCGAALASRSSLAKHTRAVHAGLRPPPKHVCHTCGKMFRGKSVLTNHVRTHTGEKPFACAHCGRKFTQRTAMTTHVKLVHLKLRRHAKIKPELTLPQPEANKEELITDMWTRPPPQCDVYFMASQ